MIFRTIHGFGGRRSVEAAKNEGLLQKGAKRAKRNWLGHNCDLRRKSLALQGILLEIDV